MKHEREWFDDEDFWSDFYPFLFSERRFADAEEQAEKALELVKPQGTDILDLCCGPGRWSVALARKGFRVTGVDITSCLLEKARDRAELAGVDIEWVQADMRDFVRPDSFDLVVNAYTSFGYFDEKHEDVMVLTNVITSLRPGGIFLMHITGKERLARIFAQSTSHSLEDGTTLVERHEIIDGWSRIRNEWLLIRNGSVKTYRFHHTIYSGQELKDRFEQVGFTDVTLYGSFDGEEYGLDSQQLIVIGHKPHTD